MIIVEGTFDPITQVELQQIVLLRKKYKTVGIRVLEDGILTRKEREILVKKAISPYRHLFLYNGKKEAKSFEMFQDGEKKVREGHFSLCAKGILTTIHENGYYYNEVAKYLCNQHRYEHSIGVAKTAQKLARFHHLDEGLSYRMGLLHDITKKWDDEKGEHTLKIWYSNGLTYDPKVWHSFTAPFFIKQNLCLYDTRILNAIWHHTLGDGKSEYAHILYIADKIEPGRGYDASQEITISKKSLAAGADFVRKKAKVYILKTEGKHV